MSSAYPTPWTYEAEDVFEDSPIRAANGEYVLVRDNGVYPPDLETCREIVEAVNERDRLRDQLAAALRLADECSRDAAAVHAGRARAVEEAQGEANRRADRLADIARRLVGYCEAVTVYRPPVLEVRGSDGTHEDYNGAELLREARAAIGEDRK